MDPFWITLSLLILFMAITLVLFVSNVKNMERYHQAQGAYMITNKECSRLYVSLVENETKLVAEKSEVARLNALNRYIGNSCEEVVKERDKLVADLATTQNQLSTSQEIQRALNLRVTELEKKLKS